MNEQELRALIRGIAAERLRESRHVPATAARSSPVVHVGRHAANHPSQEVYLTLVNVTDACVIEPAVPCTHCNYCKTHGY